MSEITELLRRWGSGDEDALGQLMPLVYDELKRLAGGSDLDLQDRRHFFAVASRVIRHILVDRARRDMAAKRDLRNKAPLEEALTVPAQGDLDLVGLDEALEALGRADADKLRVVEL